MQIKRLKHFQFSIYLFLSLFIFSFSSCKKDPSEKIVVDPQFQPFVDSYIEEAVKRGVEVDFEKTGLSIQFGDVPPNANGVCKGFIKNFTSAHEIVIHRNRWEGFNESGKERLIYHELGHCHLYREHLIDTLGNGEWTSIMRGVAPEGYGDRGFNFSGSRKQYYLDELFKEGTSSPNWANLTRSYDDIPESQKEVLIERENVTEFFRSADLTGDFEIEMSFEFTSEFVNYFLGFNWGGFDRESALEFAVSKANNIFILNELNGYGLQAIFDSYKGFRLDEINKMTVQKIGDKYFYFFNERFLYWNDFEPLNSKNIEINKNVPDLNIARITVKRL